MELNTSQPEHSLIVAKSAKKPLLMILFGVLLIALAFAASLLLQKNDQINSIQNELQQAQERITALATTPADEPTQPEIDLSTQGQTERAQLAATNYACSIVDFGCDKTTYTVDKFQEMTDTRTGYAVVSGINETNETLKLWLVSPIGGAGEWVVVYEGTTSPPRAVVERFGIPAEFVTAQ